MYDFRYKNGLDLAELHDFISLSRLHLCIQILCVFEIWYMCRVSRPQGIGTLINPS